MRIVIDTNIAVDFYAHRVLFDGMARRLLLLCGLHEFDAWFGSSQMTDLFYILTSKTAGMSASEAKRSLRALMRSVQVAPLAQADIEAALDSSWDDFEDACVYQTALKLKADAIITRNGKDFERSSIKVFDCDGLFAYLKEEKGIVYDEIPW